MLLIIHMLLLLLLLFIWCLDLILCLLCFLFICHLHDVYMVSGAAFFSWTCSCWSPFANFLCLLAFSSTAAVLLLFLVFAWSTSCVFTTAVIVGCDEAVLKILYTIVGFGNKLGMFWWRWMESHVWLEPLHVLVGWMSISLDWKPLHTLLVGHHSNWAPSRSITFSFLEIHLHEWYYESFFNVTWALRIYYLCMWFWYS